MESFLLLIIFIGLYFLPTIVAFNRNHKNATPILICNLFLGWTLIGWVGSLVWSLLSQEKVNV